MVRFIVGMLVVCGVALLTNCTVVVDPPSTTVQVENLMSDLQIKIGSTTYHHAYIDLYDVQVGDVFYDSVKAGHTSRERVTAMRGSVNISIGSIVMDAAEGIYQPKKSVSGIVQDLATGRLNIVTFQDDQFSDPIFAALGKKKQ